MITEDRALATLRLDENPAPLPKNMAPKSRGTAEEEGRRDDADGWFDQAADVDAVRLNPGGYLDIENWLKSSGRSNVDVYF